MTERNRRFDPQAMQLGCSRSIWDIGSSLCNPQMLQIQGSVVTGNPRFPVELLVTNL
jgi:hypothetical protein